MNRRHHELEDRRLLCAADCGCKLLRLEKQREKLDPTLGKRASCLIKLCVIYPLVQEKAAITGMDFSSPRVLTITDGRGTLLPDARFRVLAAMFYPQDPDWQDRLVRALTLHASLESGKSVPRKLRDSLRHHSSDTKSEIDSASDMAYGVSVTGELLLLIIGAAVHSPTDASLARAVRAWCQDQARGKTYEGKRVAASERSVKAAWSHFKSVSHLCGAWQLLADFGQSHESSPVDDLEKFLATAEALRAFGVKHHPPVGRMGSKPSKFTTLDPLETLCLPPDLKLPTVSLGVPPLTPFVQKVFAEYRAD